MCFTHSPSKLSNSRTSARGTLVLWITVSVKKSNTLDRQNTATGNKAVELHQHSLSQANISKQTEEWRCSSSFEEGNRRCYGLSTQRLASVAENNREQQRRTTAHQTTVQQQVNQTWSGWTDVAAKNKTGLQTVKQTGGSPNMFRKICPAVMVWNTTSRQKTSKTQHCQIDLCIDSQHILSWGNMEGPRALRKKK